MSRHQQVNLALQHLVPKVSKETITEIVMIAINAIIGTVADVYAYACRNNVAYCFDIAWKQCERSGIMRGPINQIFRPVCV